MKPESAAFMEKSREFLVKARGMFDNHWPDEAGRAAYLAGFACSPSLYLRDFRRDHQEPQARAE
jgi:hypothetical protein